MQCEEPVPVTILTCDVLVRVPDKYSRVDKPKNEEFAQPREEWKTVVVMMDTERSGYNE